jgi:hypothetical protein
LILGNPPGRRYAEEHDIFITTFSNLLVFLRYRNYPIRLVESI